MRMLSALRFEDYGKDWPAIPDRVNHQFRRTTEEIMNGLPCAEDDLNVLPMIRRFLWIKGEAEEGRSILPLVANTMTSMDPPYYMESESVNLRTFILRVNFFQVFGEFDVSFFITTESEVLSLPSNLNTKIVKLISLLKLVLCLVLCIKKLYFSRIF
jgi:hypothetical protein